MEYSFWVVHAHKFVFVEIVNAIWLPSNYVFGGDCKSDMTHCLIQLCLCGDCKFNLTARFNYVFGGDCISNMTARSNYVFGRDCKSNMTRCLIQLCFWWWLYIQYDYQIQLPIMFSDFLLRNYWTILFRFGSKFTNFQLGSTYYY
jgi:hypothetical protein